MATEKQILANRLNALKSTGPKTAEGKASSRGNALKHGLAGDGVALSERDRHVHKARLEEWSKDVQPSGGLERWLLASAVAASVRVDRCRHAEWAELERLRRERIEAFDQEQEGRLRAVLPENPDELAGRLFALEEFSTGCQWLAETWKSLRWRLKSQGYLQAEQLADLLSLLGLEPEKTCVADTREQELAQRNDCAQAGGEGAADARQALVAICDGNIQRLEQLAHARWTMEEAQWLNEDLEREAFDASPRGQLLRRYETASRNDVHRSLTQLARTRKEGVLYKQKPLHWPADVAQRAAQVASEPQAATELRNEAKPASSEVGTASVATTCVSSAVSSTRRQPVPQGRNKAAHSPSQAPEVARASSRA